MITELAMSIMNRDLIHMEFTGRSMESVSANRQDFVIPNSVIETSPGVLSRTQTFKFPEDARATGPMFTTMLRKIM